MACQGIDSCIEEWEELQKEFTELEESHKTYTKQIAAVKVLQGKCQSAINHQKYRMKQILETAQKLKRNPDQETRKNLDDLYSKIAERKTQFREFEESLPHENGIYLKVILGSVNVSLLNKQDKFKYKENYESFKLYVTVITIILALCLWLFLNFRVTDAAFQFLLVWYYCTLTIREHILKVNGSRIRGWWITHHFISTVCSGIILIWPDGWSYGQFRLQFVIFSMYMSFVQVLQYYYQKASLYKLRTLGERHSMDLTVEGFQSWMFRGLSFLLPFLVTGYGFQLYNAWVLFWLSQDPRCTEWQVYATSILFFIIFTGNSWTTFIVMRAKLKEKMASLEFKLRNKYRFNSKVHDT